MKKLLVLMVALVMMLGLWGCVRVDTEKAADTFNTVSSQLDEVAAVVNANLELVDEVTLDALNKISEELIAFKTELESEDITQERVDEIITKLGEYPDQIVDLKAQAEEMIANPPTDTEWSYKDVTPEQIQAISNVLEELIPLYDKAAAEAVENGWEADETALQELNTVYALIEAATYGIADPSEYEGTEDMDAVVAQYQVILGAMPDFIAKVSEPYSK